MGSFKSDVELYFLVILSCVLFAIVWWKVSTVFERRTSRRDPYGSHAKSRVIHIIRPSKVIDLRAMTAKPVEVVPVSFDPPATRKIVELKFQITNVRWPINH